MADENDVREGLLDAREESLNGIEGRLNALMDDVRERELRSSNVSLERAVRDHSVNTYEVHCARCGAPYGSVSTPDAIVLCREGCLRKHVLGEKVDKPPEQRNAAGNPEELRRVVCGQCMRLVGHISVYRRGQPTPAAFHEGACWDAYVEAGKRDPDGKARGR